MGILLSGEEVFGLAKEIEKSGHAFYKTVAESFESPELSELFEFLADEEIAHFRFFDRLAAQAPPLAVDADEWEETRAYIKATTDGRFFSGEEKAIRLARDASDPAHALDIAIGFEKDTLLYFHEILGVTPAESRAAAREIVEEEKRHVRMLSEKKRALVG